LRIDAEGVLEKTNKKFISRFTSMEEEASRLGKSLAEMSLAEMDALWNEIKKLRSSETELKNKLR
jgi:XTP/dITP diphosphohydrolase